MFKKLLTLVLVLFYFTPNAYADCKTSKLLEDANAYYQNYLTTKDKNLLEKAYLNYYQASQLEPTASSYLGMGMVFIEKKQNKQAKNCLYRAYSIDQQDASINYYLALYFFNNNEYIKALDFYLMAYEKGLSDNYDLNLKLGIIYEKVGDIEKATLHYNIANSLLENRTQNKV